MKRLYITVLSAIVVLTSLYAQDYTAGDIQHFRVAAFNTMLRYQKYMKWLRDEDGPENFCDLFTSDNDMVFNDLLGLDSKDEMTVMDYATLLNGEAKNITVDIKDVEMGKVEDINGVLTMDVTFNKVLWYETDCHLWFKSDLYYGEEDQAYDYTLEAVMEYDQKTKTAKIKAIKNVDPLPKPRLTEEYIAIRKNNADRIMDSRVKVNGKKIEFEEDGACALYPVSNPSQLRLSHPDDDVNVGLEKSDKCENIYFLKYKRKSLRAKLWFDMSMGNFYKATTNTNMNFRDITSKGMEFGVDFGYVVPNASAFKFGMFVGVGYSKSNMDLLLGSSNFSFQTNEDIDRDSYTRRYYDVTIKQKQDLADLVVPAYFELGLKFGRVTIFTDLGVKGYYALSSKTSSISGSYRVNGLYSQYDNLVFGPESGLNGFTNNGVINNSSNVMDFTRKSISLDATASLGIRVDLAAGLQLEVGAGYQRSIGDCYTNTDTYYPCNYTVSGGEYVDIFRSVTKLSRDFIKINAGLTYKF